MRTHLSRLVGALLVVLAGAGVGLTGAKAANLDEACGGKDAITCNSALWCQKTTAGQCGVEDAVGRCDKAPAFCMRVSRPVCGCNGKTYPNDCERQRLKVQLDYVGACKVETPAEPKPAPAKKGKKAKKRA